MSIVKLNLSAFKNLFRGLALLALVVFSASCVSSGYKIKKEKESEATYKLGMAYLNDAPPNLQKGYIEFLKSVESNPNNKDSHYAIGHIYAQRQDYPNAIASFKKAILIDPQYSAAYNYLGKTYELSGNDADAILSYQEALKNLQYETPQFPRWNMAMIYLKQRQYQQGLDALLEVRRIVPTDPTVLDKIGETYLQIGKSDKARLVFEEAVFVAPGDYLAHYRLASFYLEKGEKALASNSFKKVVELAPESTQAESAKKRLELLK
ncbi:MAG: tetratricopeptide repeat protein [Nitrospirota bacterium]